MLVHKQPYRAEAHLLKLWQGQQSFPFYSQYWIHAKISKDVFFISGLVNSINSFVSVKAAIEILNNVLILVLNRMDLFI